jgi:formamidopyrimidine-DNA glycosylase
MPELPEVETVRSGLNRLIIGKKIISVSSDWPKSFPNDKDSVDQFLINAKVMSVSRRGKALKIDLDNEYTLVIHLKMTGQLVYRSNTERFGAGHPNESLIGELPDKSTRVIFEFDDHSKLFFNDQRKFGWVRLLPTVEVGNIDFFKKIGPEPLEPSFTLALFKKQLSRRPGTSIKAALLDQTVLAGIGNIYADESLWAAKIHPATLVRNLTDKDIAKLRTEIQAILRLSIEKGGSTDRNYVDAEGRRGSYLQFAKVFRLQGSACQRCGHTIIKIRVAGRGTHICPHCQKVKL